MFYSMFQAEHVIFFTTNRIILINRFLKMYEIVIVQNLAIRYVTMVLLQKIVPNFKVIKMFVFVLFVFCILYYGLNYYLSCTKKSEKLKNFRQKLKLFSKSMGYYKLSPARYVTNFGIIILKMVEIMTFSCVLLHVRVSTFPS